MRQLARALCIASCAMVVCSVSTAGSGRAKTQPSFLLHEESDGWSIRYDRPVLPVQRITVEGIPHLLFHASTPIIPADSGMPQLPVEAVSLGIPFDAAVSIELVNPVYEESSNRLVAPVPGYRRTAGGEPVPVYRKNRAAYNANRFYPGREIWSDPPFILRLQRIVTFHLAHVHYNPVTKVLRRLVSGTLRVRMGGRSLSAAPTARPAAKSDPQFEGTYRNLILNYDQARQWRAAVSRPAASKADPTRAWFATGRTYYRIPVATDGWYRLTKTDLALAGAPVSQFDPGTAALIYRGSTVPLIVRPDSSLSFYAVHNYGDSTSIDYYTDTSAYWLTWGGIPGPRFTPSQPGGSLTRQVYAAIETRHYEQNTEFYQGTTERDLLTNGPVAGQGWVWEYYYPGQVISHTFVLDGLDQSVDTATAAIRVRLFSTTLHYQNPDHRAWFWINDSLLGQVVFNGRTAGMFAAVFPRRWLLSGSNTITIKSDPPTTSHPNQFYLDWFEMDYPRILLAQNGQLVFKGPQSSGAGPVEFNATGFTDNSIEVFDMTTAREITGGSITGPDVLGNYSIAFEDTFVVPHRYAVIGNGAALPVLPLTSKVFQDIRNNATGADYIIITHRNFFSAAQQLAAFRRQSNGVRVKVVDVQDIYDEFNYGAMNGEKIKSFLDYAYTAWPGPPPAYLLMFGEACWDYHHYLPVTVKNNYVPAYGIPAGDNWFASFDSVHPFLAWMSIGRLPVQDPVQAQRIVAKITGYESTPSAPWKKTSLFISGGTDPNEQVLFNGLCDGTINEYILPPPYGGFPYKVYKATPNTIDGENKQLMQDIVNNGVAFINFLGHSGGRIWGVDIGSPNDLQNTGGQLPFVASVSCNVGAFADPTSIVLSEDFVLADNRGAIAMWASSTEAYATVGSQLVNYFLQEVTSDSERGLGALTTAARIKIWLNSGSADSLRATDYITLAAIELNPLLGDPLSPFALPVKPDLAVAATDLSLNSQTPTPNDSLLTLSLTIHNDGLVPSDSVTLLLTDLYSGQLTPLLNNVRIAPTRFKDSLAIPWRRMSLVGKHTFQVTIDPAGLIPEVTKVNNVASLDQYVYANLLYPIRPLRNMVVPPGVQILRVTGPIGVDSASMQVAFELDTSASFSSPLVSRSAPVMPGPVSAEWQTPSLPDGRLYYWRARAFTPSVNGAWVNSMFSTSSLAPALPTVRWRESSKGQFAGDPARQTAATDSGVTIGANSPISLYVRSLGYRADANKDYYSLVQVNEQSMTGLWWVNGSGFMGVRVDAFSGVPSFQAFDVADQVAEADSMVSFINVTPPGNYLAFTVIYDGQTNLTLSLRSALKSLGSSLIDSVQPGNAWSIIARKGVSGPAMTPLEHWSPDGITADSLQVPNYYSAGSGTIAGSLLPMPQVLHSFRWSNSVTKGTTDAKVAILGVRSTGNADTLRMLPVDSTAVDISGLNGAIADPSYTGFRAVGLLSSKDALVTPVLKEWSADFEPSADLAVSSHTLSSPKIALQKVEGGSVTLGVWNIGYRRADSARVVLSVIQPDNSLRPVAYATVDSIPVGGVQTVHIPFSASGLPSQFTIQARVAPPANQKELVWENNVSVYNFVITGVEERLAAKVQVFADGVQIMDGDYVAARPKILVRLVNLITPLSVIPTVDLFVDNTPSGPAGAGVRVQGQGDEIAFAPALPNGTHELRIRVAGRNSAGGIDSVLQRLTVNVTDKFKILQMFNYPDPFATDTWFTFVLTGNAPPEELTVRIYTVAGRKIRELHASPGSLQVGFNRIYWDGRDAEGDQVANGYYLYQVQVRGEGNTQSAIGKLARIR